MAVHNHDRWTMTLSGVVFPNISDYLLAWIYWLFISYTTFFKYMYLFLSKAGVVSGCHFLT